MTNTRTLGLVCSLLAASCAHEDKAGGTNEPTPSVTEPAPTPQEHNDNKTPSEVIAQQPSNSDAFVKSSNELAMSLYRVNQKKAGNMVFSPASISLAFSMTYAGASSKTADEMAASLHLGDKSTVHSSAAAFLATWNKKGSEELTIVNRLFGQSGYKFETAFLDVTKSSYQAPLEQLDFSGAPEKQRQYINKWVMEQTQDKIDELLPSGSIDPNTRLVLTNAVYFLGKWRAGFPKKKTKNKVFWVNGKEKTKLPTMALTQRFAFAKLKGAKVLELPYEGSTLAMDLILPDKKDGLSDLETQLSSTEFDSWTSSLKHKKVSVELPRFELKNARIPLKDSLQQLGMKLAFDSGKADFTGMSGEKDLYISDAFHEAFVKVDESGTEAAAATAVVMTKRGGGPPAERISTFHADRPFLFAIRDTESGAILFLGRVLDPQ